MGGRANPANKEPSGATTTRRRDPPSLTLPQKGRKSGVPSILLTQTNSVAPLAAVGHAWPGSSAKSSGLVRPSAFRDIGQTFAFSMDIVRVRLRSWHARLIEAGMEVAGLILPVFAVIVTGWAAGFLGYVSRDLSDGLIHFAYNVAMPALLIVTIAQEPAHGLLAWRFLIAFGGGSLICFALVFLAARILGDGGVAGPSMQGWAASMTNTGFVALPILQATYGPRAVLPAAIATVFVAVVMFPCAVVLQELDPRNARGSRFEPVKLARHVILNPMVLSARIGVAGSALGAPMPGPVSVRAIRNRARPLDRRTFGQFRTLRLTDDRQAPDHAAHRPRLVIRCST
jgi:hypothetical protein